MVDRRRVLARKVLRKDGVVDNDQGESQIVFLNQQNKILLNLFHDLDLLKHFHLNYIMLTARLGFVIERARLTVHPGLSSEEH